MLTGLVYRILNENILDPFGNHVLVRPGETHHCSKYARRFGYGAWLQQTHVDLVESKSEEHELLSIRERLAYTLQFGRFAQPFRERLDLLSALPQLRGGQQGAEGMSRSVVEFRQLVDQTI